MRKRPDYFLIGVTSALIILGILILSSVSASLSQEKFGNTYYFLSHQLLFGLLPGILLAFWAFRIRLDSLKKWAPALLLINLILLAMVFLPIIGSHLKGASRWLDLKLFSFQPSEFLKLTFILYLAVWLAGRTDDAKIAPKAFSQTLLAFFVIIGIISLLLVLQPDISTLGVILATAASMYFLSNTPLWHSIFIILIGVGGLFSLIKLAPYRASRLAVFFNPEIEPMGIGYQMKQSLIAIGSGGIFGVGLGMSRQKFGFLPESVSDSIFAIFGEEAGLVGTILLICIFLLFFWRGFKIAKSSQNKFCQLTALGITFWIVIQGFANIGSMTGILPLAGIPLPFISYGGSALIAELIGAGILLNISKR